MQLTKQTDFAFRTLLALASLEDGELSSVTNLCDYYDISHNHLAKVVQRLSKLGYIIALRGKGGGICLAKKPSEINLADVVRDFEAQLQLVNCSAPVCKIVNHCKLHGLLGDAMAAFMQTLEAYTLADVLVGDINMSQVINVQ